MDNMTTAPWSIPPPIAPCLISTAATLDMSKRRAPPSANTPTREPRWKFQRAAVETARKEADYLRHAAEELAKLAPQPGEEATLAARRQAMMQGEKVRQEIVDAGEAIGGASSPIPSCQLRCAASSAARLRRRN